MRTLAENLRGVLLAAIVLSAVPCWAQRVQFSSGGASATNTAFQGGTFTQPNVTPGLPPVQPSTPVGVANPNLTTPGFGASGVPANNAPSLLGQPTFDPFSTSQGAGLGQTSTLGVPQATSGLPPNSFGGAQPLYTQPGVAPGQGFPTQPPVLYPNSYGNSWGQNAIGQNSFAQQLTQPGPYLKLLEELRISHTWIPGDRGNELDSNDVAVSTSLNFPNFLYSNYPITISPGFIFHFWNGPSPPILVDLPARMYSTYLQAEWNPMTPTGIIGAELAGSIGIYSDFDTINSQSIRLIGKALLVYRATQQWTFKGGIEYLDRVHIKLLPAGGVLWTPNDRVRFDIYFPKPKLAQYLITIGTTEIWWYLAGEYGYGSWTYERQQVGKMGSNRFDINDLRVLGGLEWTNNATTLQGFIELGYVFDRKVQFRETPQDNFRLQDSLMLRSGIAF